MKTIFATSLLATALALGAVGTFGTAQVQAAPAPKLKPVKTGKPDIVLKCCKCIGGRNEPVNISTGTAAWTVSKTPTAPPPPPPGGYAGNGPIIEKMPSNYSPQVPAGNIGPDPMPGTWATIAGASWIQPGPSGSAMSFENGHWTYALKIQVPDCTIPQKVTISGQLAADDMARMYVDHIASGTTQALVDNPPAHFAADGSSTRSFSTVLNPTYAGGFTRPGNYIIRVEMDNLGGSVSGIVLNAQLSSLCSDSETRIRPRDAKEAAAESAAPQCPDC